MADKQVYAADAEAQTEAEATRVARLALIHDGKAPGTRVHIEQYAPGQWEVMFEVRPLGRGQGFLPNGQRYSLVGATRNQTGTYAR